MWVSGTNNNDVIQPGFQDSDGDCVDGNDAKLPGEVGDDDIIYSFDGDDYVEAGAGDDEVFGGGGDDVLRGGEGNDVIYGDNGGSSTPILASHPPVLGHSSSVEPSIPPNFVTLI